MRYKTSLFVALLLTALSTAYPQELGLKRQQEALPAPEGDENSPVFVDADRIWGRQAREIEASGNVQLRRTGEAVFADYLRYDFLRQEVVARGNLRVERQDVVVTGVGLRYNLADSTGEVDQVEYFLTETDAHGEASRLIAESRDKVRIEKATYTNCAVGDEDWYLRAKRLDLDQTRDLGVARNASIVFKGVPILYSPYLDFSLSGSRKSGFLPPSIGQTGQTGFDFTLPYYFNLAPNYDATFAPRYMERRGVQLGGEFRYLWPSQNGWVQAQYLDYDRVREEKRYALNLEHRQRFGANTTGYVRYLGVSDDFYFVDLSNQISATSLTNLPREAGLSFDGSWWNLSALAQDFQTLQDPLAPVVPPYARIPQIRLFATRGTPIGLDLNVDAELVKFDHPTLVTARRDMLYPSLSLPWRTSFFYVTPKVGYNYTRYNFDSEPRPARNREMPIYSVDSAIAFERPTTVFGTRFTQTLEPRLYYVYIPYRDQSDLPVFDTAEVDFNLASIFTENQFSGDDRINDANQLTAAVTSRLLDPSSGDEQIRLTIGQRYYFSDQLVTLNSPPRESNRSDVLLGLEGTVAGVWKIFSFVQYGAVDDQLQRNNQAVQYKPEPGKVVNLAYRFTRDQQEQVDLSAQWPLSARLSALARWNQSLLSDKLVEGLAGLEYNAGCWTARLVAHRFVTSADEYSDSFFLQLELNGVSRIGVNPLDTLRRNISGYTKGN
ncbi:MAG: LPS assembly protein LptD [Burkholderiales bacterium]|nr:LPS assembly protein LptD [Burkholderiales bacterium]